MASSCLWNFCAEQILWVSIKRGLALVVLVYELPFNALSHASGCQQTLGKNLSTEFNSTWVCTCAKNFIIILRCWLTKLIFWKLHIVSLTCDEIIVAFRIVEELIYITLSLSIGSLRPWRPWIWKLHTETLVKRKLTRFLKPSIESMMKHKFNDYVSGLWYTFSPFLPVVSQAKLTLSLFF